MFQDNAKFIILKSFICACAAIFTNLIVYLQMTKHKRFYIHFGADITIQKNWLTKVKGIS